MGFIPRPQTTAITATGGDKPRHYFNSRLNVSYKQKSSLTVTTSLKGDSRSQVQGSTFRVKDQEDIKNPKFSLRMLIPKIIANRAPNFGLGLMKLMRFS